MISLSTTTGHLEEIFKNSSMDALTRREAYIAANRNLSEKKKNTNWLRNRLHYFKHYGLAKAVYEKKHGSEYITGIKLTGEGKKALMQRTNLSIDSNKSVVASVAQHMQQIIEPQIVNEQVSNHYTDIARLLKAICEENPNAKVSYSIKDEVISVQHVRG
jgi:hypothetical protein